MSQTYAQYPIVHTDQEKGKEGISAIGFWGVHQVGHLAILSPILHQIKVISTPKFPSLSDCIAYVENPRVPFGILYILTISMHSSTSRTI